MLRAEHSFAKSVYPAAGEGRGAYNKFSLEDIVQLVGKLFVHMFLVWKQSAEHQAAANKIIKRQNQALFPKRRVGCIFQEFISCGHRQRYSRPFASI